MSTTKIRVLVTYDNGSFRTPARSLMASEDTPFAEMVAKIRHHNTWGADNVKVLGIVSENDRADRTVALHPPLESLKIGDAMDSTLCCVVFGPAAAGVPGVKREDEEAKDERAKYEEAKDEDYCEIIKVKPAPQRKKKAKKITPAKAHQPPARVAGAAKGLLARHKDKQAKEILARHKKWKASQYKIFGRRTSRHDMTFDKPGTTRHEPEYQRTVYYALANDTLPMIAEKFQCDRARLLYDNKTSSVSGFQYLTYRAKLEAGTPIVMPLVSSESNTSAFGRKRKAVDLAEHLLDDNSKK